MIYEPSRHRLLLDALPYGIAADSNSGFRLRLELPGENRSPHQLHDQAGWAIPLSK